MKPFEAINLRPVKLSVKLTRSAGQQQLPPTKHTAGLCLGSVPKRYKYGAYISYYSQGARWQAFATDSTLQGGTARHVVFLVRLLVSGSPRLPRKSTSFRPGFSWGSRPRSSLTESHPSFSLPPCHPCCSSDRLKPTFLRYSARLFDLPTVAP